MLTTLDAKPGQNRMWAVYPFGEDHGSIRVNQLILVGSRPPRYNRPRMEISIFWINSKEELRMFRGALVLAQHKFYEWSHCTGDLIDGTSL